MLRPPPLCLTLGLPRFACALLLAAAAHPAAAQTPGPLAEWQYSAGVPLMKLFMDEIPTWQVSLGAAASLRPRYDGAADYRVLFGPSIDIRYRDSFFASTGEGLGWNALRGQNWRAGIAMSYNLGRREKDDSQNLSGMGRIDWAPEAKLFAEYAVSKAFPLVFRVDARRSLGGSDGWIGDIGLYLPMPGSSETFFWFAGPNVTLADSRYMQTWFGVSPQQAARTGYRAFNAGAGVQSVSFGVSAVWFLDKHWFLTADTVARQLVGDARNSPLTRKSLNTGLDFSVNYQF